MRHTGGPHARMFSGETARPTASALLDPHESVVPFFMDGKAMFRLVRAKLVHTPKGKRLWALYVAR